MIELINVSKYFVTHSGRHYVFRDVNLVLPLDKSVAVIGPNGAGKSTFLRLLGGADQPSTGTILKTGRISPPMGLTPTLQPSLNGVENARFAGRIYGMERDEINEMIEYVRNLANIGKFFNMPVSTYSAGMRQRVAFAINMSMQFDYYLFDEIGAGGDREFRKIAKQMVRDRLASSKFIMTSHNTGELLEICDSGIVIQNGELRFFENVRDAVAFYGEDPDDELRKEKEDLGESVSPKTAAVPDAGESHAGNGIPPALPPVQDRAARGAARKAEVEARSKAKAAERARKKEERLAQRQSKAEARVTARVARLAAREEKRARVLAERAERLAHPKPRKHPAKDGKPGAAAEPALPAAAPVTEQPPAMQVLPAAPVPAVAVPAPVTPAAGPAVAEEIPAADRKMRRTAMSPEERKALRKQNRAAAAAPPEPRAKATGDADREARRALLREKRKAERKASRMAAGSEAPRPAPRARLSEEERTAAREARRAALRESRKAERREARRAAAAGSEAAGPAAGQAAPDLEARKARRAALKAKRLATPRPEHPNRRAAAEPATGAAASPDTIAARKANRRKRSAAADR